MNTRLLIRDLSTMVALSRCLGPLALLIAATEGGRIARKRGSDSTKFIAGVPVLNYHTAYGGARLRKGVAEASFGELEEAEQEWVVMLKPGTTDAQVQSMCKLNKNGCNLAGHPGAGVPFIELRGSESDLESILKNSGGIAKYVEPDSLVYMIPEIEADVQAATWGLNRVGADQRGRAGAGATVFVLDTGVRSTHTEFGNRAASALDMTSGSPVECNGDLGCANDAQGHGTHCAGTAAGETFGGAPSANVRSVKVLGDSGSGSWSWSYGALDWLATGQTRPAVASMSLGGSGTQQAMRDAVDAAELGSCCRGCRREQQLRRVQLLACLRAIGHHCRLHHQHGREVFLQQLRGLHEHLGARKLSRFSLPHVGHRQPKLERHFNGLPPRVGRRCACARGESIHEVLCRLAAAARRCIPERPQ